MPKPKPGSPDLREALAKEIRRIYTWERRFYQSRLTGETSTYNPSERWDGRKDDRFGVHTGKRPKTSTWLKIADFVLRHRVDPASFVRAQFNSSQRWLPLPNQMTGPRALANYLRAKKGATSELRVALAFQRGCFKLAAKQYKRWFPAAGPRKIWSLVLLNESLEMTALFRYCVAVSEKLDDEAQRFKAAAAIQYTRQRAAYDETWGTLLPAGFGDEAEVIYRRVLRTGI